MKSGKRRDAVHAVSCDKQGGACILGGAGTTYRAVMGAAECKDSEHSRRAEKVVWPAIQQADAGALMRTEACMGC